MNMQKDNLYELTCEHKHLELIIDALSNYICSQYDGIDQDVADVAVTTENIKIASDIQSVLKYELGVQQGVVRHPPQQSSETTGLVWVKEAFPCQEVDILTPKPFTQDELDNSFKNVLEKHKNTLQRLSDK